MDTEIKEKWVTALRSGEYNQGENCLKVVNSKDEERHCCLGVLCEVVDGVTFGDGRFHYKDNTGVAALPTELVDDLGLNGPEVRIEALDNTTLTAFNDGLGDKDKHSFDEIADIIEKHL